MSIEALTIVTPRPNPVMYTSLAAIEAAGGVYSPNLLKVEIRNRNTSQGVLVAQANHITGNEYAWDITGLQVASIGLNTIDVVAYATDDTSLSTNFQIYVDYTAPSIISHLPAHNSTNVATNQLIQITFNELMSPSHVINAITVEPPITDATWQQGTTTAIYNLAYVGYLEPFTTYTITVANGAKDALAAYSTEDVYVQAGTGLATPKIINFTTGAGIGPRDPTRRGLVPAEEILYVAGQDAAFINHIDGYTQALNSNIFNDWLNTAYTFRSKKVQGNLPEAIAVAHTIMPGYGEAPNPPGILNPFRYKKFNGQAITTDYLIDLNNGHGEALNDYVFYGYLSTQHSHRYKPFMGKIMDMASMETMNYIPIVLTYQFENKVPGQTLPTLETPHLSLIWDNPRDKDDARVHYQVELSQYPSFYRTIAFDTTHNAEVFWVSSNDDFVPMTSFGAPSGTGQTRFMCPAALQHGIWYVRLTVGNKRSKT